MLSDFTDSALALLIRYCDAQVSKHRYKLEEAVSAGLLNKASIVLGSIQELQHTAASANSILRDRAKGQL